MPPSRPASLVWGLLSFTCCLAGIAGLWRPPLAEERRAVDALHVALAQHADAFLRVATPWGVAGGYDPAHLLSGANALAGATFWPGHLQLVLGGTPLVPDDVGLLPLPDSVRAQVETGLAPVFVDLATVRVAIAPFRAADGAPLGWVASWGALEPMLPTHEAIVLSLLALGLAAGALGVVVIGGGRRRLGVLLGLAAAAGVVLALDLGRIVDSTSHAAVQARLITVRQLLEVAATAPQVRQAELPALALDLEVELRRGAEGADQPVTWDARGASVVAATPRTQGSLLLRLPRRGGATAALLRPMALGSLPFGLGLLGLGLLGAWPRR